MINLYNDSHTYMTPIVLELRAPWDEFHPRDFHTKTGTK